MKVFCIGRNYAAHAAELNNAVPDEMVIFMKPSTAVFSDTEWYIPDFALEFHHEVELVLKVAKNGKHIAPQFASKYFEEIALGIDFTARDLQTKLKEKGLPWEKAKAFDKSALIGEFIPKSSLDISSIDFSLVKNHNKVQEGNSSEMLYNFEAIIVEISKYFTLQQGDLIYTGTPKGVSAVRSNDILEGKINNQSNFKLKII
ncbi:MAG: fumarylacetoacetate hydrolase family protein [Chitinophagales bacterium]|jgi:2-keto-4-pentenoate hydratase/2-oxohepta-3-ene-1,7-dioic acid hydratase in catechol pathway|nr:fumarylacetoacetate hydrolase family protein [Chitinophagales bacterium]